MAHRAPGLGVPGGQPVSPAGTGWWKSITCPRGLEGPENHRVMASGDIEKITSCPPAMPSTKWETQGYIH